VTDRYPLEALIKSREWELEELATRLSAARGAVEAAERAVRRIASEIAAAESELLREGARQTVIQVDKRRISAVFLRDRHDELRRGRDELSDRRAALAQVMDAVLSARRAIRALERHKERLRRRGEELAAAKLQKTLDDLWLSRRARHE
jgi:flagellar biosynthesis chaperone FliJ